MQTVASGRLTIRVLLSEAERVLAAGTHSERARRDAEELLLFALQPDAPEANRAWLITHGSDVVSTDIEAAMRSLVERRLAGEPVQYIAREAEFYGLRFGVNRDVLIPRPETELVVEKALELAKNLLRPRVVDVGTGSGAIALTLKHERPDSVVTATEISKTALRVARGNAERLGVLGSVRFLQGDLLAPVGDEQFDIVVSNLPYVGERDRDSLAVEVREFEPAQALFAGADGLDAYRRLIPAAYRALLSGGFAVLEIGYGQGDAVRALLEVAGFVGIEFTSDLQGIPRVIIARRP